MYQASVGNSSSSILGGGENSSLRPTRRRRAPNSRISGVRRLAAAAGSENAGGPPNLDLSDPQLQLYGHLVHGKRFTCTECGKCCTGAGEVWANDQECAAMARALGLSPSHFLARHTKSYSRKPGWRLLRRAPGSGDCVFLRGGKSCAVYGARPLQCSTYPWWPELMDPAAWGAEAVNVCEGIMHPDAPVVDAQQAAQQLRAATEYMADLEAAAPARRRPRQEQPPFG